MNEALPRILLVLLLGAWVSLEERSWPLLRFREPLVGATLAGAILGAPWAGLAAGAVLQALWLLLVPSGGNLLPAVGLAGVVGGAVTAWGALLLGASGLHGNGRPLVLGLLFALGAAEWGRRWESRLRRQNGHREDVALQGRGPLAPALRRARRAAFLGAFSRGWMVTGFSLAVAGFVYRAMMRAGALEAGPVDPWGAKLPLTALGLGIGALGFSLRHGKRSWIELALGLLAGVLLGGGLIS